MPAQHRSLNADKLKTTTLIAALILLLAASCRPLAPGEGESAARYWQPRTSTMHDNQPTTLPAAYSSTRDGNQALVDGRPLKSSPSPRYLTGPTPQDEP